MHFILGVLALANYPGKSIYFLFFSLAFFMVLFSVVKNGRSPSYVFFGILLWLGFFLKTCMHLILKYPFFEPVGNFTSSSAQWDQALIIAGFGGVCCAGVKLLVDFFTSPKNYFIFQGQGDTVPVWYQSYRKFFLTIISLCIIALAYLNFIWGVNISGLAAITVLPFHLNALFGWLLYIGFVIVVAQVAFWDMQLRQGGFLSWNLSIFESFASSLTILSRGLYLFHSIPTGIVQLANWKTLKHSVIKVLFIAILFALGFLLNTYGVNHLRDKMFNTDAFMYDFYDVNDKDAFLFEITELKSNDVATSGSALTLKQDPHPEITQPTKALVVSKPTSTTAVIDPPPQPVVAVKPASESKIKKVFTQISTLAVDRWVGIEGVLAVSTYPERSFDLLKNSFFRKPKIGELDVYEKIARSVYMPSMQYSFASIPGPIAFFYYADSLLVILLGLGLFVGFMYLADTLVFKAFKNNFLSIQISFYLAMSFSQFGLSPRPLFISFFMTTCGLIALKIFLILVNPKKQKN